MPVGSARSLPSRAAERRPAERPGLRRVAAGQATAHSTRRAPRLGCDAARRTRARGSARNGPSQDSVDGTAPLPRHREPGQKPRSRDRSPARPRTQGVTVRSPGECVRSPPATPIPATRANSRRPPDGTADPWHPCTTPRTFTQVREAQCVPPRALEPPVRFKAGTRSDTFRHLISSVVTNPSTT
jgi:hypothetical protein